MNDNQNIDIAKLIISTDYLKLLLQLSIRMDSKFKDDLIIIESFFEEDDYELLLENSDNYTKFNEVFSGCYSIIMRDGRNDWIPQLLLTYFKSFKFIESLLNLVNNIPGYIQHRKIDIIEYYYEIIYEFTTSLDNNDYDRETLKNRLDKVFLDNSNFENIFDSNQILEVYKNWINQSLVD